MDDSNNIGPFGSKWIQAFTQSILGLFLPIGPMASHKRCSICCEALITLINVRFLALDRNSRLWIGFCLPMIHLLNANVLMSHFTDT